MSTKKVVHITTVHHPLDPRIYYKECLSLKKAGYDVTLIVPDDPDMDKSQISIIPLKKYKNRLWRMVLSTAEAYRQARKLDADYYHIHDPELLPVAWMLKKRKNIVIYDIHEDYVTSILQKNYLAKPLKKWVAKAYKMVESFFSKRLELCLAEKYYKQLYPRGVCILNYPILNQEMIQSIKVKNTSEKSNKLIYTGNVTEVRGATIHARLPLIDDQISVYFFGKCDKKLADHMMEIAGEQRERLYIKGIEQYVPKREIDQQYENENWLAGLALFPPTDHYRKKELTKFFEYMSAGIPIICSDFPVWKQFVEKHGCGIAVNPYDDKEIKRAIDYLRLNPEKAKEMGQNGQIAVIKELNWESEGNKLCAWYKKIWDENVKR
jgi:glycosyltransferase involved in cell wall biosynthesis